MSDCRVFIVLATCEGEAYLPQLLTSIGSQSHAAWTLLARDDRSRDATPTLLRAAAGADARIVVLEGDSLRLGTIGNFGRLLHEAVERGADFVFLADQDDVWHADKIARQLEVMREAQASAGGAVPRLVFSDAAVIDAEGKPLHSSFLRQNRLVYDPSRPLATLLGRSFVLGCTSAVNRALLEFALPLPERAASHDWWLALCAAATGELLRIDAPLIDYRRHAANASQSAIWNFFQRPGWRRRWAIGWDHFLRSLDQARAIKERLQHHKIADGANAQLLDAFCRTVTQAGRWRRIRDLHRLGVPRIGALRRLIFDVCVWMNEK